MRSFVFPVSMQAVVYVYCTVVIVWLMTLSEIEVKVKNVIWGEALGAGIMYLLIVIYWREFCFCGFDL